MSPVSSQFPGALIQWNSFNSYFCWRVVRPCYQAGMFPAGILQDPQQPEPGEPFRWHLLDRNRLHLSLGPLIFNNHLPKIISASIV